MRFGVVVSGAEAPSDLRAVAARAAEGGFDTLLMTDHLQRQAAVFSTLGFLAAISPLRLGTLVLSHEFRHPVVAAKEFATLDVLCDGRLDVGLGVGWDVAEFASAGIPFPSREERIARLRDGIDLMRAFWSGMTVCGTAHFPVDGVVGDPLPVQRPHPPLLLPLGTALALASDVADIVEIGGNGAAEDLIARRLSRLRERRALRPSAAPSGPQISALLLCCAGPGDARLAAEAARLETTVEDLARRPSYLIGSTAAMREELERRTERLGLSYVMAPAEAMPLLEPVIDGNRS
jgi:probable F420-dependent oxidoreductase